MAGRTQPLGKDAHFSYPRIGRTATADIRIQVRGHVIPIRVTGPAVHTVIPITADDDAKGTPAKNLFSVYVLSVTDHVQRPRPYATRDGSDAPRQPTFEAKVEGTLSQPEQRDPQYTPRSQ